MGMAERPDTSVGLRVPSAIVKLEFNVGLNPVDSS